MKMTAKIYLKNGNFCFDSEQLFLSYKWYPQDIYPVNVLCVTGGHIQFELSNGEVDGLDLNHFMSELKINKKLPDFDVEVL